MKAMQSDADILRTFTSTGDESAFREIVRRHAPMVHGVAWRRTNDRGLAEEVTQTVFTILARKAATLAHQELAGWLHRAAFVEGRNAQRKESRRRRAMSELTEHMNEPPSAPETDWRSVRLHIDELLGRLSSHDRQLVVLRFYEQRSYREISAATGGTEDSTRKRIERSLERLAGMLRQRGVMAQGSALGSLLTSQSLCPHRVSAAHISSTALKSASAGSAAAALPLSLYLMTTTTKLTLTAAALVLIAVPGAIYLNRNHDPNGTAANANITTPPADAGLKAQTAAEATTASNRTARPAKPAGTQADGEETVDISGLQALFSDGYSRFAESNAKVEAATQLNKLTARLKLNDEQQKALSAYFDRRNQAISEGLKEAESMGLMDGDLSDKQWEALAKLEKKHELEQKFDDFFKSTLTPQQYADQIRISAEQKEESAQDAARSDLDLLVKYVDLNGAERDKVFDAIAQHERERPDDSLNLAALARGTEEPHQNMLKQVLSEEQWQTYQKGQEIESRQTGEMLRELSEKKKAGQ